MQIDQNLKCQSCVSFLHSTSIIQTAQQMKTKEHNPFVLKFKEDTIISLHYKLLRMQNEK